MRIFEIASAEEQIELWKLISNSVWQSLQQQQRAEQQRKAADLKRKPTPKAKRSVLPLPSTPIRNVPNQPNSSVKTVSDQRPDTNRQSSVPVSIPSTPSRAPSTRVRSINNFQLDPRFLPSDQNQEFPAPLMAPTKPGSLSRKA